MTDVVEFYGSVIRGLKDYPRYSSLNRLFFKESVADHVFALNGLIRLYAAKHDLGVDVNHSLNVGFAHDLGEYLEGDVCASSVMHGFITKEEKNEMECRAWSEINQGLLGDELQSYWLEYEAQESIESKYVKVCDKLEAMLHMSSKGVKGFKPRKLWRRNGLIEEDYDMIVLYADEYMKSFVNTGVRGVESFEKELGVIKSLFKPIYGEVGVSWKEEYNYCLE